MKRLLFDESGTTAIEYSMIAGLVSVFIIGALLKVADGMSIFYLIIEALPIG